jgi:hypothetical protein
MQLFLFIYTINAQAITVFTIKNGVLLLLKLKYYNIYFNVLMIKNYQNKSLLMFIKKETTQGSTMI